MNRKISLILFAIISLVFFVSCEVVDNIAKYLSQRKTKHFDEYVFPGIKGPLESTPLPLTPVLTKWETFKEGGQSRLAIYLTTTDSDWIGLVRGFKSFGIPFVITQDLQEALQHHVVFAYPYLSYPILDDVQKVADIKSYLRSGGVILTGNIYGSLNKVFNINEKKVTKDRDFLSFKDHPWTKIFIYPEEKKIQISEVGNSDSDLSTTSFENKNVTEVALYDDNSAAIIAKKFGNGQLVVFGIDLGYFFNKSFDMKQPILSAEENPNYKYKYANLFMPTVDVFLRLVKEIYIENEPNAVSLYTVPFNRSLSVVYTHDIDYNKSVPNSVEFAKFEKSQGLQSTYFVLTHYVGDYEDTAYFNQDAIPYLNNVHDLGMEIASEGVSHAFDFDKFSMGTGKEFYPEYFPKVIKHDTTYDGTIMGELRVSKFLLNTLINHLKVISFRPGGLLRPKSLPQCITATEYKYTSASTANNAWTHLPFQLTFDQSYPALLDLFEFPITIEDIMPPRMDKRINEAIDVAKKISRYGGLCLVLSHPDVVDFKLEFEKMFMAGVKDFSWIGTLSQFGNFWAARNQVEVDVKDKTVSLKIPVPISGLTLNVPAKWTFESVSGGNSKVTQEGGRVIIDHAEGNLQLTFRG